MRFNCALLLLGLVSAFSSAAPPNIIVINADDLGYGDTGCYGATAIKTPNIDRIAREGLRFTDAHASAATCTPSRYSLLTGEYAFRQKGTGILPGDAALIIKPGRLTLPGMLKSAGYKTGVVGKWHLGLGGLGAEAVDWNNDVKPGPMEIGFTESFIMAATGDRVPCVFVNGHRVVNLDPADPIKVSYEAKVGTDPTGAEHPELLKMKTSLGHDKTIINGISRIGYMDGGKAARWTDEELPDTFLKQAIQFVERNQASPFFLYYASHEPHVPRVPHPRFVGATTMGPRGDAIAQFDWSVGEILNTLDRLKLTENTLLIFTSDNGPVVDDGYQDQAAEKLGDHKPAGPLRGGKYTNFEAGTRVPFIVRWPAKVKPGVSSALICQIDLLASFAKLSSQSPDMATAPDSQNVLPALLGESTVARENLVEQAQLLSLREGTWKYISPPKNAPKAPGQLYDLATDLAETKNLAAAEPERVKAMAAKLAEIAKIPADAPAGK